MPSHRVSPPQPRPRDLWRDFWRPSWAQLTVALFLFLVSLAGTVVVRSQVADDTYELARRDDLVVMLDSLNREADRLEEELDALERTRDELRSGADSRAVAREELRVRVATLGILGGTVPAQGPGIQLVITDPQGRLTATMLLDALAELRDAGAEVIEINDEIRVTASSVVASDPDGVTVDGVLLSSPCIIEAIGDPHALAQGARFRGGIISQVESGEDGATAYVSELERVEVTSTVPLRHPRFAEPQR